MLKSHFANAEKVLLALRDVQKVTGHTLHKGSPREAFIDEFLRTHLCKTVAISTGEIIDANSNPGEKRPQMDIVLYKQDYPKLDFGGGISGFLAESVIATIEVKSCLTEKGLLNSARAAATIKRLDRNITTVMTAGYTPPTILCYVLAYDGPAKMATVHSWNRKAHDSLEITVSALPADEAKRMEAACPTLDGIFVLGKGFVQFDNGPIILGGKKRWSQHPPTKWCVTDTPDSSLLFLFLLLTSAMSGVSTSWLDPLPYVSSVQFKPMFVD